MYVYIYIYIERERDRDRDRATHTMSPLTISQVRSEIKQQSFNMSILRSLSSSVIPSRKFDKKCRGPLAFWYSSNKLG